MSSKQPIEIDDGWESNTNGKCGWCDNEKCECDDKAMYLSEKYDSFLEIENNYFEAWADHKILPHEALAKFFKCIELCDNYNQKYANNPEDRDPNHELKLLRYHYNSLKYCVQTQYTLKKYNKDNSYSSLIYGYIRNIINNDFDDDQYILIPFALVNLIVVFYDELITNYSQLLQLSLSIQNSYRKQADIEFITLNSIRNSHNVLNDTISFTLSYVKYHEQKNNYFQSKKGNNYNSNKKENELAQLYWNTIVFLQMNNIHLWFKYAVKLAELYMKLGQYKQSKEIMKFIDDQQLQQRRENRHVGHVIAAKYYACKIEHILIDIANAWTGSIYIDGATKSKLMGIYNDASAALLDFAIDRIDFYYFKIFLLFRDYEKADEYLTAAMEGFYSNQDNHSYTQNVDQLYFEYGLILYVMMNALDDWDENAFHLKMSDRFPSRYHVGLALSSRYQFLMAKYNYDEQIKLFVEGVKDESNTLKQLLLPFNTGRSKIDTFLMERCIKIIRETC